MPTDLHEIRFPSDLGAGKSIPTPAGLEDVPGGWVERTIQIGPHALKIAQPAVPDAFLDDPGVEAQHAANGYMPYWAYLWPAALKMAAAVLNPPWPVGSQIVELGAGIGVVGLASLARGDQVVFTDYEPQAVALALYNAKINGFSQARGAVLDWDQPVLPPNAPFDAVIGSEVIYENRNHEPILRLLPSLMRADSVCWLGDAGRTRAERFFEIAPQFGYRLKLLDAAGNLLREPLFGQYQLFELCASGQSVLQ